MDKERARRLFLTAFFLFALANGLSGSIISNYFKDVFQVDSVQRGLLEIPRELPGVVGVFVIAALPSLGNVSLSVLGFALYCVGLLVLGLFSPGYFVMQLFVFTYSLGDHMVMPIRDAIAMDLADEGKTGKVLKVLVDENRAIVEGVHMVSKSTKPSAKNPQGGIVKQEAPIHISNLSLIDPKSGKATRIAIKREGKKVTRIAKKSGEEIK